MEAAISYFLMLQKYINLNKKNLEIKDYMPCLVKILKDFTINNMKKKKKNMIKRNCNLFFC